MKKEKTISNIKYTIFGLIVLYFICSYQFDMFNFDSKWPILLPVLVVVALLTSVLIYLGGVKKKQLILLGTFVTSAIIVFIYFFNK